MEAKLSALQANEPQLQPAVPATDNPSHDPGSSGGGSLSPQINALGVSSSNIGGTTDLAHPTLVQLRSDLTSAQRTKAILTSEISTLKSQHAQLTSAYRICEGTIAQLTTERDTARSRLSNREEEMQYKNKQVERLQDDIIALEMELNVLHDQKDKLQTEHDSLVVRIMKYKEREAEEMINNSKYS